jgi:hypothetical protein
MCKEKKDFRMSFDVFHLSFAIRKMLNAEPRAVSTGCWVSMLRAARTLYLSLTEAPVATARGSALSAKLNNCCISLNGK